MSLIDERMTKCTRLVCAEADDGQGGQRAAWTDGDSFMAAIAKSGTTERTIAQRRDIVEEYTVTVEKGIVLKYDEIFRREADAQVFRVTSNIIDRQTPDSAGLQIGNVRAERWEVPS